MEEHFALGFSFCLSYSSGPLLRDWCRPQWAAFPPSMDTQDNSFTGMAAGQSALGDLSVETPWMTLGCIKLRAEAVISLMV